LGHYHSTGVWRTDQSQ